MFRCKTYDVHSRGTDVLAYESVLQASIGFPDPESARMRLSPPAPPHFHLVWRCLPTNENSERTRTIHQVSNPPLREDQCQYHLPVCGSYCVRDAMR